MDGNSSQGSKLPVVITAENGSKSKLSLPKPKILLAVLAFLFIIGGIGAGVYLIQKPQDVTPQAVDTDLSQVVPSPEVSAPPGDSQSASQATSSAIPPPILPPGPLLFPTPSASASAIPAGFDFNGDEKSNSVDLSIMYSAWGTPQTDTQKRADLNGDGVVNGIDYSLFLPHFKP